MLRFSVHQDGSSQARASAARRLRPRLRLSAWLAIGFAAGSAAWAAAMHQPSALRGNLFLAGSACLVLAALRWRPLRDRADEVALAAGAAALVAIALRGTTAGPAPSAVLAAEATAFLLAYAVLVPLGPRRQLALGAFAAMATAAALALGVATDAGDWGALIAVAASAVAATAIASLLERGEARAAKRLARLRRLARAPQRAAANDDRIAHLSHDLRNPLAVAFGYSEMAGDADLPDEERRRALARVKRSLWELTQMVENVLETSADEAGALVLRTEPVEASGLCEELSAAVEVLARGKPVQVQLVAEPGLLVLADRQRLGRVLSNLLGNAIKYTPRGVVTLRATRAGDRALLEVCDTGPGIAADELTRIFDRYRQLPGAGRGGVGLGLAISRMLTERMGGSLAVDSTPGIGSRFAVSLPLAEPAERRARFAAA